MWILVLILAAVPDSVAAADQIGPNVIVILADDMGYGDAGCYGSRSLKTPYLDRLASEGIRFTDFHSSGTVCSPTRAGLMTGRYQQRAGIPGVVFADPSRNRHHGLHTSEVTLPELLQQAGYATGILGKWHLGYRDQFNPTRHGFDLFRGFVSGNVDYITHVDGTGRADWWRNRQLAPEEGYLTHMISRRAVQFIEQNQDRPFFLYVAHGAVHSPYQAPGDRPVREVGRKRIRGAARKDIPRAYAQMMTELDNGIGEIMATLKRCDLQRNTFVIFFSDNGANPKGSNGALRGFKGSVWEGGHRVPAIVRWSGTIAPGRVCDDTVISLDIMPTVLAAAKLSVPTDHQLDGVNLVPLLVSGTPPEARKLFWDFRAKSAVRDGDWKLVVGERGAPRQLYNLRADFGEQRDVAQTEPERVQKLSSELERWQRDVNDGATVQPSR